MRFTPQATSGGRWRWRANLTTPSSCCASTNWNWAFCCSRRSAASTRCWPRTRVMLEHRNDWLVRETIGMLRRTLARLDVSSRSMYAIIEPGSCFAGVLFELALAADRSYMLALPEEEGDAPSEDCGGRNEFRFAARRQRSRPARNSIQRQCTIAWLARWKPRASCLAPRRRLTSAL